MKKQIRSSEAEQASPVGAQDYWDVDWEAPAPQPKYPAPKPPEGSTASGKTKKRKLPGPVDELMGEVDAWVAVPKQYIPKVIGKKGSEIIRIKNATKTRWIDAHDQSTDPVQVHIRGKPTSVQKAEEMIQDIVYNLENRFADAVYIDIPEYRAKQIVGEKGARVSQLQSSWNVKLDLVNEPELHITKVYIRGSEEDVEKAKERLNAMAMMDVEDGTMFFNGCVDRLVMPEWGMGILLGAKGFRVRELQAASGASIDAEKKDGKCHVCISGTSEQIECGVAAIFEALEREVPGFTNSVLHFKGDPQS